MGAATSPRAAQSGRSALIVFACIGGVVLNLFFLLATAAHAQGGPPFRTDDPDTPGNHHWEVNLGWLADRNPAVGAYQVPDFDINYGLGDRLQLKYELPIAIEEVRPQPARPGEPASPGSVIGGIGESLLGVKWRFYEHHPRDPWMKNRWGTGLLGVLGHARENRTQPAGAEGDSPGASDAEEPVVNLGISTYPQLFLDNPTRAVPRGLVAPGPSFFLPLEVNGRIGPVRLAGIVGYTFGNHAVAQNWNRGLLVGHEFGDRNEAYLELYDVQDANRVRAGQGAGPFATGNSKQREFTLGLGGRHVLNRAKTFNLLLMAGRSLQATSTSSSQPGWIAYVGVQVLLGPKETPTPQVERNCLTSASPRMAICDRSQAPQSCPAR